MSRPFEPVRRIVLSASLGVGAAAACSAAEAAWSRSSSGASPSPFLDALTVCFGLIAPLALAISLITGAMFAWLSPDEPPSFRSWIAKLRTLATGGRQADVAAFAPLAVIAAFLWMTSSAHLARSVLSLSVSSHLAGLAVMGSTLGLGLGFAIAALACVPALRRALAKLSESRPAVLDPALTGGTAIVVVLALFLLGLVTGTVSGDGGFFGIWGIFKRGELDLRAPAELSIIFLAALFAPNLARPPRTPSRLTLVLLGLLTVGALGLLPRANAALNASTHLTQAVERGAPLSKLLIGPYRKLRDRDADGVSGAFGGGDCDDANPAISPLAEEHLDNGIDEDCSGADLTRATVDALAPTPEAVSVDERLIPNDLNVVVISVDTLRWDLGYAGYKRPISPNIDALAARSAIFDRAYSLASYTGKSIGPMLIGKYGSETNRNWGHFNKFSDKDTFVAQRLQAAGVRTMGVHAHRYFDVWGGLERGFDVLDFNAAPPKDAPWDIDTKATSEPLTDAAIALLQKEENTSKRFFMWIHYLDPHADYLRHEGIDFGNGPRDLYDGEVAYTDRHIGRLLEAIDRAPWGKRTAVILTSDHGESFGENGFWRHGFEVWETLVRVPLLVYVPGAKPKRVGTRRSLIDLVPTVLELMHVPRPPESEDREVTDFLSGQSLLVDVYLPEGKPHVQRDILIDMPAGPYNDARRALIHGDDKLVVSGESRFDLYDLANDPGETRNLAAEDKDRLKTIKERYAALKANLREVKVTGKRK